MSLGRWLARGGSVLVLAAGIVAAGKWFSAPESFPLRKITIEGDLQHADRSGLMERVRQYAGTNFVRLRLGDVEAGLLEDPWVEDVSVQRVWPDRLIVSVSERTPVARWGLSSLLDRSGAPFAGGDMEDSHLPLLWGPDGSEKRLLATYRRVRQRLGVHGLEVEALFQDARRAWRVILRNGMELEVGRQAFDERLARFTEAYPGLLSSRADAVAVVDLRYSNGFAVRWRQPSGGQAGLLSTGKQDDAEKG